MDLKNRMKEAMDHMRRDISAGDSPSIKTQSGPSEWWDRMSQGFTPRSVQQQEGGEKFKMPFKVGQDIGPKPPSVKFQEKPAKKSDLEENDLEKSKKTSRARSVGRGKAQEVRKVAVSAPKSKNPQQEKIDNRRYKKAAELFENMVRANIEKSIIKAEDCDEKADLSPKTLIKEEEDGETEKALPLVPILAAAGRAVAGAAAGAVASKMLGPDDPNGGGDASYVKCMNADEAAVKANIEKSITNLDKAFVSEAQRRYFYANKDKIGSDVVKEFENKTPKNKDLPERVKKD